MLADQEMQANAKSTAAPGDGAPGSDEPKMDNQHTKLDNALVRTNSVRTHMTTGAHSRCGRRPVR